MTEWQGDKTRVVETKAVGTHLLAPVGEVVPEGHVRQDAAALEGE